MKVGKGVHKKRGILQKMSKHIEQYSAGSIFGRNVYIKKKYQPIGKTSVFGKKVYKNNGFERSTLCLNILKKFRNQ